MTVLKLVSAFNSIIGTKSRKVTEITDETRKFLDDMMDTLHHQAGATGLAAVQVGRLENLIVINLGDGNPRKLINARITWNSEEEQEPKRESCLTLSDYSKPLLLRPTAMIPRWKEIEVEYLDEYGKQHRQRFDGDLARTLQHEIDHIEGKTFADHRAVTSERREQIFQELRAPYNGSTQEPPEVWGEMAVERVTDENGNIVRNPDGYPVKRVVPIEVDAAGTPVSIQPLQTPKIKTGKGAGQRRGRLR